MLRLKRFVALTAVILASWAPAASVAETLTIGTLNQGIRAQMKIYEPFAAYIEQNLQGTEVTDVRLMVVSTANQMADAIKSGEVDIFIASPLVAGKVSKMSGATPFMRRIKEATGPYYSVIIAHVDSGIEDLDDLKGKRIAFEEPDSTTGFLLPAYIMTKNGLKLREVSERHLPLAENEVGYVFSSHDKNTIYLIASGRVDAAATHHEAFLALRAARPGEYRVIASSPKYPRKVLLHRAGVSDETLSNLRSVLLAMPDTPEGRLVLKKFEDTGGFDDFPEGANTLFKRVYKVLNYLNDAGIH